MAAFRSLPSCRLIFLFCLVCFSMTLAKKCTKLDTCSCKMDDGSGIVSLQDIDNPNGKPRFTKIPDVSHPTYTFEWNPCTTLKAPGPCNGNNVCQYTTPKDAFPAGQSDTTFTVDNKGNVVLTYGKKDYKGYIRYTIVTLKCDKTQTPGSFGPDGISEETVTSSESKYSGTFTSKCACPGACNYSSGLSVGSILLIIFFSLVFLYFVLGIIVNRFARHKEGFPDVIPNHSFWGDLPFLVKDGSVFSFFKVKGCCSSLCGKVKGDDSYTKI